MKNKGQLRMQEMAFMLVAIVLLFTFAGLFLFSIFYSNLQKEIVSIKEEKTLSAVTNLADSPELGCGISRINCVDTDKAMALMNNKNYENFWPFSSLEIIKVGNKSESSMIKCTGETYPDCDRFIIYNKNPKNERKVASFVALCRVEKDNDINYQKCEIGKLVAGTDTEKK